MKEFNSPKMEIVRLSNEDVVCTSTCIGYICNECVDCKNAYVCDVYEIV